MRNTRNNIMMCPLEERVEKVGASGGNDRKVKEVEEEVEDEELGSLSCESHQPWLVEFSTFSQIKQKDVG